MKLLIGRRFLLFAGAATFAASRFAAGAESPVIPLWPDEPPGGGGPVGPPHVGSDGAITGISTPSIEVVAPGHPNGAAVLIAAGGGYRRIQVNGEARPAARWLAARGITAFILTYRLPLEGWHYGPFAPLQDAQRALRVIRARAEEWKIDPHRVGVLGFSAGGHLMGLCATRPAFDSYPLVDAVDARSARPDVAALIYPVITLEPPYDRTSTRRALIGDDPPPAASREWSVQTHVRSDCPPVFLVQAEDDPISDPQNTLIMAEACREAGVPVEFHSLPSGGHGFSIGKPGTPAAEWPNWFDSWLRSRQILT